MHRPLTTRHAPILFRRFQFLGSLLCSAILVFTPSGPVQGGQVPMFTPRVIGDRQNEIASIHVAVTSVRPWEEYVEAMQPKFTLSAEQALDKVLATTLAQNEQIARGFGVAVQGTVFGGELVNPATNEAGFPTGLSPVAAKDVPSGFGLGTNRVTVEPTLQHRAALALYQEVQILNRAFRDAVEFEGFTPYVVRLQVSVIPRRRDAPYDVNSDLSFFVGSPKLQLEPGDYHGDVKVLPMLATDAIESALHARSDERLRNISLALSAVLPSSSLGARLSHFRDQLESQLGRDYNSTFTIARVTDNAVRCRFGAISQSSSRYSLVPQNHFVTLIVFARPCGHGDGCAESRKLRVIANSSLIQVETGRALPQQDTDALVYRFRTYLTRNRIRFQDPCLSSEDQLLWMSKLFASVAGNDFRGFLEIQNCLLSQPFAKSTRGVLMPDALWADMVEIWGSSQYSIATFEIPKKPECNSERLQEWSKALGLHKATFAATDNGKATVVRLPGFPRLNEVLLLARLSDLPAGYPNGLVSGSGAFDEASQTLTLTFPSLKGLGDGTPRELGLDLIATAKYRPHAVTKLHGDPSKLRLRYVGVEEAAPKQDPGFKFRSTSDTIAMAKDGTGEIVFEISGGKDGATFDVVGGISGAVIASASSDPTGAVIKKGLGWSSPSTLSNSVVVTLKVSGLNPAKKVIVDVKSKGDVAANPLTFEVLDLSKK